MAVTVGSHPLSAAEWQFWRWGWRATGRRTGTPFARVVAGVWGAPDGGTVSFSGDDLGTFRDEVAALRGWLDRPLELVKDVDAPEIVSLIERSGLCYEWRTTREVTRRRRKARVGDDEPQARTGELPGLRSLVDALTDAEDGELVTVRWGASRAS